MRGSAYKIFGLNPGASEEEIRKRYRSLVKKYHPDVNKEPNAQQTFLSIQDAYEELLKGPEKEPEQVVEEDFETHYRAYRSHAQAKFEERKKREETEMNALYEKLQSGHIYLLHRIIAYVGLVLSLLLFIDNFLPTRLENQVVGSYSTDVYQSMNGNFVSLACTNTGERFFLNSFSNNYFDTNPFIQVEKTAIFHQPIEVQSFCMGYLQKIPIHFTFYWAQAVLYPFFLLPFIFLRYRKKDAFFIMGSYFSRIGCGLLMLYFLMSSDRWMHLLTLGFY
ncbi:MAG: J domain-containing protein [Flavobacteriales bacterium]